MATSKTQGIVLKTVDYQDNDQIVTIFSSKFGKLAFLALGVNRIASKNKYSLLTFNFSEFEIFKARQKFNLSKLKTGILIHDHLKISHSYLNYLYAISSVEIVNQGSEYGQKNFRLFQSLQILLDQLNSNQQPLTNFVFFLLTNLAHFGGHWQLNQCVRCTKKYQTYRLFSFTDFGLVCPNCHQEDEPIHSFAWIHFLQTWEKQKKLGVDEFVPLNFLIILGKTLISYYQENLGIDHLSFRLLLNQTFFQTATLENNTYSVLTR